MKKQVCYTTLLLVLSYFSVVGQAKKYVLFEHFTNAGCAPCAEQNPVFQAVFQQNLGNANHIEYHTVRPGRDVMHEANPTESSAMSTFYSNTTVPTMYADGTDIGSPVNANQGTIDNAATSPIRLIVNETDDNGKRLVNIEIQSVGDVETNQTYRLRVAVVEELIEFDSAPGSNGEKVFHNVFRQFLGGGSAGENIQLANQGESVNFNYDFELDSEWKADEIYVLAYVQDMGTKEVLNSARSGAGSFELTSLEEESFVKMEKEEVDSYESNVLVAEDQGVVVEVIQDSPADWAYTLEVNGASHNSGDEATLAEGMNNIKMDIKVGSTAGVGIFTLRTGAPGTNLFQQVNYTVISDVTDLIIVTDNVPTSPIANSGNLTENYLEGIAKTGNNNFGKIGSTLLNPESMAEILDEVEHIYYSIGWTFPPLSDDMAQALMNFLDRGGNLLIAGQDVGWAINASTDFGTVTNQKLYTEYLQSRFLGDGDSNQNVITFEADDPIYGGLPEVGISAVYADGSNDYLYPDAINPSDTETGNTIWRYNNNRAGAVRTEFGGRKVVNVGVGLEMFADRAVADEFMLLTHDYFHSPLSSVEFLDLYENVNISASPNPVRNELTISIDNLNDNEFQINVYNVHGLQVETITTNGLADYLLNVNEYANGLYFYQLTDGKLSSPAQKFIKQ